MNSKRAKEKHLLYIVPSLKFFSEGYRGRVMHALGICEGYAENSWSVSIIGGEGLASFSDDVPSSVDLIEINTPKGFAIYPRWLLRIGLAYWTEKSKKNFDTIMVRYVIRAFLFTFFLAFTSPLRSKTILEVNSFAYHWLRNIPNWMNGFVARTEMLIVNRYKVLYVVSQAMKNDKRNSKCRSFVICIPNGATSKQLKNPTSVTSNGSMPRLVYFGTLMSYWDFSYLIQALNYIHEKAEIDVLFLGDGPELNTLQEGLKRPDLISFYGRFAREELGHLLSKNTDFLILPPKTKEDMILTGGLSTKIFDYLAMGMPILAPSDGEIVGILENRRNALLYQSNDPASVSKCLDLLVESKRLRQKLAQNAYFDFQQKYSWKARMNLLINEVEKNIA